METSWGFFKKFTISANNQDSTSGTAILKMKSGFNSR